MPAIKSIRPVLLSAPYSDGRKNAEVQLYLKSGYRTTGLVQITLDDGTTGLGEGYIAVFAPLVFRELVVLIAPDLIGKDAGAISERVADMVRTTGYWSWQGAARHVIAAIEIALYDALAKCNGIPLYAFLGAKKLRPLRLYASGGNSLTPEWIESEFEEIERLGIDTFKIRARNDQIHKAVWCIKRAARSNIGLAVDMTQNLAVPSQTDQDVMQFVATIEHDGECRLRFLEEILGPLDMDRLPALRQALGVPVAGGEIVTTPAELCRLVASGAYDYVQPDATVIGGIGSVLEVFETARIQQAEVLVHCWGSAVGMMANYHTSIAGGGIQAEWPIPEYSLRNCLLFEPWKVENGVLHLSEFPGLGVVLSDEIERRYPFREEAVYRPNADRSILPSDEVWQ